MREGGRAPVGSRAESPACTRDEGRRQLVRAPAGHHHPALRAGRLEVLRWRGTRHRDQRPVLSETRTPRTPGARGSRLWRVRRDVLAALLTLIRLNSGGAHRGGVPARGRRRGVEITRGAARGIGRATGAAGRQAWSGMLMAPSLIVAALGLGPGVLGSLKIDSCVECCMNHCPKCGPGRRPAEFRPRWAARSRPCALAGK